MKKSREIIHQTIFNYHIPGPLNQASQLRSMSTAYASTAATEDAPGVHKQMLAGDYVYALCKGQSQSPRCH